MSNGFFDNVKESLLGTKSSGRITKAGTAADRAESESGGPGTRRISGAAGYQTEVLFYNTATGSIRSNWYKQLPYSFVFTPADKDKDTEEFSLPISPSNISIVTHFATNTIATMYGTVEEHSEQRYFDINISGTTGMAPRYYDVNSKLNKKSGKAGTAQKFGRAGFEIKKQFGNSALGGFFRRTLNTIENALNQANDLFGRDKPTTGIDRNTSGYVAFHNFYKFLLTYKKDAAENSSRSRRNNGHPLTFRNYKDNNEYDVSINNFQLTRDASNPMLYNYTITMRAYNLRSVNKGRLSTGEVANRLEELGLGDIKSNNGTLFSKMSNKARSGKNAAFSAIASFKGFGL
jgi:hypothetical protein